MPPRSSPVTVLCSTSAQDELLSEGTVNVGPVTTAAEHVPITQVVAPAQTLPQRPQFALLVLVLTSHMFAAVPSQFDVPAPQVVHARSAVAEPAVISN